MEEKKQSMLAILKRLEATEKELKEIRQSLVENMNAAVHQTDGERNHDLTYTLDDLYQAFGNSKKHYATRLRHALQLKGINSLAEFLAMTPGQLLELDNVNVGTLQQTKKVLDRLGICW